MIGHRGLIAYPCTWLYAPASALFGLASPTVTVPIALRLVLLEGWGRGRKRWGFRGRRDDQFCAVGCFVVPPPSGLPVSTLIPPTCTRVPASG